MAQPALPPAAYYIEPSAAMVMNLPAVTNETVRAQAAQTLQLIDRLIGPSTKDGLKARDELQALCGREPLYTAAGYRAEQHPLMNPLVVEGIRLDPHRVTTLVDNAISRGTDTHWLACTVLSHYCLELMRQVNDGRAEHAAPATRELSAQALKDLRMVVGLVSERLGPDSNPDKDNRAYRAGVTMWQLGMHEHLLAHVPFQDDSAAPLRTALGREIGIRIEELLNGSGKKHAEKEVIGLANAARALGEPALPASAALVAVLEHGTSNERSAAKAALVNFKSLPSPQREELARLAKHGKHYIEEAAELSRKFPPNGPLFADSSRTDSVGHD